MKPILYCLLVMASISCVAQQKKEIYPSGIEHVIGIGIDGLSPDNDSRSTHFIKDPAWPGN